MHTAEMVTLRYWVRDSSVIRLEVVMFRYKVRDGLV